jgi:hypothetical protein
MMTSPDGALLIVRSGMFVVPRDKPQAARDAVYRHAERFTPEGKP